jgi:polysaccharide chain length determinant protein (PEP-CTERM system associated)
MSIEFRQKTPGEIWQIIKRRKWHILLPTLAVGIAVAWVIRTLPETYESTTLLTIKPPTISDKVVQSLSDDDMSQRLQTINQNVLSRSSLEPILTKLNVFAEEKAAGVPTELLVDRMRKNITVVPVPAANDKISGFRITYRDRSPQAARDVTAALAAKYVNEQVLTSTQSAETTSEFINQQLEQAKSNLDSLERERLGIMTQNVEALPESGQGLIAQLEGLRQREQTISKEKEGLIAEKGRINDSIRALNSQARLIEDFGEKETQQAVNDATRIEDTPAYAQLVQRRAELSSKLENLKLSFKEKHPEVIKAQNDINKVNDEIEALSKNTQKRVQQANQSSARKAELQKKNLEIERQKAESQIAQIESQFEAKNEELRRNAVMIGVLESKINAIPNVKVALEGVTTRYQSAKTAYDEILKKYNNAQGQVQRETNEQGETIRVVDAANLPQTPVNASKKPLFVIAGFGFGLFLGLLLAAVFEIPQISKVQNIEDMKHYTGLPILASVPPLLSNQEISRKKSIYSMKVLTGVLLAIVSIPLLIFGLEKTRIFERFL